MNGGEESPELRRQGLCISAGAGNSSSDPRVWGRVVPHPDMLASGRWGYGAPANESGDAFSTPRRLPDSKSVLKGVRICAHVGIKRTVGSSESLTRHLRNQGVNWIQMEGVEGMILSAKEPWKTSAMKNK